MNSERRKKKGLQGMKRGNADFTKTDVAQMEKYDTTPAETDEALQTYEDNAVDTTTDVVQAEATPRLNDINNVAEAVSGEDDTKTMSAKFFGFVRNKYDDAVQDWEMKKQAKQEAYQQFLQAKPKIYQKIYQDQYEKNLLDLNEKAGSSGGNWTQKFAGMSQGMRNIGSALGGNISPDKIMGFKGTVLGPLPTGYSQPMMQQLPQGMQNVQRQFPVTGQQAYPNIPQGYSSASLGNERMIPQEFNVPGVTGSQVPKYQSMPRNADPSSVYARVIKVDRFGKRRSYLRKMTVPQQSGNPMQMPRTNIINVTPQQQAMQQMQEGFSIQAPNPFGVRYGQERLIENSALSKVGMDSMVDLVKNRARLNFNVDNYLK